MSAARILVFAGSIRPGSFNAKLAETAARSFEARGAAVTRLDLGDYALPIYDARIQEAGFPQAVLSLHELFSSHQGVFITSPEYNAFPSPLLLNVLDWLSRLRHFEGGMVEAFERPVYAISAASMGPLGGYRGLTALRYKLELGLGATVMPAMAAVGSAHEAVDADGNLQLNERSKMMLEKAIDQTLAAIAR